MTRRETGRAIGYMLIAAFFFCFTEICLKELNHALHPVELNFSRYLLAGLLLWPCELPRNPAAPRAYQPTPVAPFHLLGFVRHYHRRPVVPAGCRSPECRSDQCPLFDDTGLHRSLSCHRSSMNG